MSLTSDVCAVCGFPFHDYQLPHAVKWERRYSPERVVALKAHPECRDRVKLQNTKEGWSPKPEPEPMP